jgi:molecular chaperone GrpE
MTAFKYFKGLRRKHPPAEQMIQKENLTDEQTSSELRAPEDEEVVEQDALDASQELILPDEEIELSEAAQDPSGLPELTETAEEVSASQPRTEAVPEQSEIPESSEAEQAPRREESVISAESQLIAELSEKVKSLIEEKESLFDRLLRKQAEFENFRKRTEKEKQEFYEFALSGFVTTLLPVLDGLERSLSAQEGETVESFRKGNELILKQFRDQLWSAGIQPIRSMGKIFDPNFHQAVMREESSTLAENEIIEEYQRGYLFKDRLLRPSMVKVASAPPSADSETDQVETESHEEESPAADETASDG